MRSQIVEPGHGGRSGTKSRPLGSLVMFLAFVSAAAARPVPVSAQVRVADVSIAEYRAPDGSDPLSLLSLAAGGGSPRRAAVEAGFGNEVEEMAARAVRTAGRFVGTRYRWGGDSPSAGFDCSGFVRYVFREQGIELPRTSREQARAGRAMPTSLENLAVGDLLFFAQRGSRVDHVAIYAGDGRIVHSSRRGFGVRYDELDGEAGRHYARRLIAVRRVIGGESVVTREVLPGPADTPRARRELPLGAEFGALETGVDGPAPGQP